MHHKLVNGETSDSLISFVGWKAEVVEHKISLQDDLAYRQEQGLLSLWQLIRLIYQLNRPEQRLILLVWLIVYWPGLELPYEAFSLLNSLRPYHYPPRVTTSSRPKRAFGPCCICRWKILSVHLEPEGRLLRSTYNWRLVDGTVLSSIIFTVTIIGGIALLIGVGYKLGLVCTAMIPITTGSG
ncbi:hypothetical protein GGR56DRAFT_148460 [Xylariaceae sp. FL0804]|nr:hypothetical protein GGR56DRAFT_148460 [Xylariaceae sp. FL0804]